MTPQRIRLPLLLRTRTGTRPGSARGYQSQHICKSSVDTTLISLQGLSPRAHEKRMQRGFAEDGESSLWNKRRTRIGHGPDAAESL